MEAAGPRGDLRARHEAELVQDVLDVALHGPLADDEPPGDLLVRQALGDQRGHLLLARGELRYAGQVQFGGTRRLAQRLRDRLLDAQPRPPPESGPDTPVSPVATGGHIAVA